SFFASLKRELVHHERYTTRAEAKASIFEYIKAFYNRVRRHSSLYTRSLMVSASCSPRPGTPGRGVGGEGRAPARFQPPHPNPSPPAYRGRGEGSRHIYRASVVGY